MPKQYPRELRECAVRLVAEHRGESETEYAAIRSIAAKLGIAGPETLRRWIRKAEVDAGERPGVSSGESEPAHTPRMSSFPSCHQRCQVRYRHLACRHGRPLA